jgi:hypothetical protein
MHRLCFFACADHSTVEYILPRGRSASALAGISSISSFDGVPKVSLQASQLLSGALFDDKSLPDV